MSQPHNSKDLSFVRHPTKRSTYIPGHHKVHYALAYLVVCLGVAILVYVALVISASL